MAADRTKPIGETFRRMRSKVRGPLLRVQVEGDSMLPFLQPGDRLLVWRTRRIRPGDIAVAGDPRDPSRTLVKRVKSVHDDGVVLQGDNRDASTDSRAFGALPPNAMKGRAVYRYAPLDRSGRL